MKIQSDKLIDELAEITNQHLEFAQQIQHKSIEELNFRKSPESWNTLECLEHLNLYGRFYIPEIHKRINSSKTIPQKEFKSGLLGNYFAKTMLPKEKLNKMKTFKSMNPIHKNLDKNVLDEFISQQKQMLELLEKSRNVNLQKVKTSISISKFIQLKLGDTFRVVINHNTRHIAQIKNIFSNILVE